MRCHYTIDKKTGNKVLIPGCMAVAVSNDIDDCTCLPNIHRHRDKSIDIELNERDLKELIEQREYKRENLQIKLKG